MNNKIAIFSKYNTILFLGIVVVMAAFYMGMAHQMQLERQSVTGLLYAEDQDAAKKYADIIMLNHVNNQNAADGVKSMIALGYSDTAFINNANRYPVNWMIASAFAGIFFIFAGSVMRDRMMRKEIAALTDYRNKYEAAQKRLDGMNACLIQKNNQIKAFIENIAHQIRTPISYVYLTLDETYEKYDKLLKNDAMKNAQVNSVMKEDVMDNSTTEKTDDYLSKNNLKETIVSQNEKLKECSKCIDKIKELLSRLLKIARLESGKVIMEMMDCNIAAFLTDICEEYTASGIDLQIHTSGTEENIAHIDPEWFREAVVNILNNAIEHSQGSAPIHVEVFIDTCIVNIRISNYGKDIAESDIPHIFDRFYTAENVLYSHTGIGLNLSNLIITQHNGTIQLISEHGHTEFLIHLPKYKFTNKYVPVT